MSQGNSNDDIARMKAELVGTITVCQKCSHEFEVGANIRTSTRRSTVLVTDCPECGETTEL